MATIRTSHAGSLPRTPELIAANKAKQAQNTARLAGQTVTEADSKEYDDLLRASVVDLVQRQKDLGISLPNDGEYGHAMASDFDYGAWWHYSFARTGGLELHDVNLWEIPANRSTPGSIVLTSFPDRRDRNLFPGVYADPHAGADTGHQPQFPKATGPISYTGHDQVAADIANLKAGLAAAGYDERDGYINALSPGSASRIANEHYATEEEFIWAWADVLREEYLAITEAGLTVQVDDPSLAENFDQINPEPSFDDYRAFTQIRIDALNHALRGIDPAQVRIHTCWGSWHGPHVTDLPFKEIVDQVLTINAAGITFEAANVRHEHEWRIWEDTTLPEGKYLIPGIVSHATNVVEHPELVADRIERFANLVGPENVVASTDCGLGGRVHPEIAVAKLQSLIQGAEIAGRRL
ncbi:5-methyltetrahydropteroyltriglutamate--homocysteine methyltransferase [Brevibacterium sanguinis]|uniref:5-methyltetrahydropteroyltriglutamate--homocysteine methyltransferase n=2 Tax=Brevibacterium TaxID=1696 RepID=A0A366IE38_9MICO|nr:MULTISPECIES: cobalamin-independent methionine synthase II family protein [Brevibacterium]RBP62985.1 5-methyltetrahydropteroyltriglutamate--homocysteine methyltransferase [Brevibacterium sanguinis]RBP69470.1 5-methyltetrahydropteroyltriglutamate--homocysteine methyltransferase [Brevibacterium celere]